MRCPSGLILGIIFMTLHAIVRFFYFVQSPIGHHGTLISQSSFNMSRYTPVSFSDIDRNNASRVLLFVHIQKTGGTLLERRLTWSGIRNRPCLCSRGNRLCQCRTTRGVTWLVSRFSTGWICGLHADLTEYSQCVDQKLNQIDGRVIKRKIIYFTLLRNPIDRYLSEWLHTRRGATWRSARLRCNGNSALSGWYRPCYSLPEFRTNITNSSLLTKHLIWSNITLDTFLRCPFNLANNRQTRMLANLSSLGCYSNLADWLKPSSSPYSPLSNSQRILCLSAKYNLAGFLHTFGLSDHMVYTQYLLQRALKIVFNRPLTNLTYFVHANRTRAQRTLPSLSASELRRVQFSNRLDAELYNFAKRIFILRFTARVIHDSWVHFRFRRPLYTLWRHKNWQGLEYTLFHTQMTKVNSSFYFKFSCHLIRMFERQLSLL